MCTENNQEQGAKRCRSQHRDETAFDGHTWAGYRTYVQLVRDSPKGLSPYCVRAPNDIYRVFSTLSECDRERFYAVHLDAQNQICGIELVSQGTINSSLVAPREVYKAAILSNAMGIVAVHNHPSGNPAPSADDRAITRQLVEAGRILDITLYDHVIVGLERYFSFAEAGLL